MTYCIGIKLDDGLVLAADTRTNAGVDYVSTYEKLHLFGVDGERQFVLLTAGNLATTQAVVHRIRRDLDDPEAPTSLFKARYLFEAADYVGNLNYEVQRRRRDAAKETGINIEANFLLAGQIGGQEHSLFQIYPQGNYIATSRETPFLQIGESKYGKPILDRVVEPEMSLEDGGRCALVSLDSTMRSNVSVGVPFDLVLYAKNTMLIGRRIRYKANTPYYASLKKKWNEGIRRAFKGLPRFDWEK
jgi:putative proteasome-type protease